MVKLHLKQGDESLFLYETTCQAELSELIPQLVRIQNGRLKIERLFYGKYKCSSCLDTRQPGNVFKKLDTRQSEVLTNFLEMARLIPLTT